MKRTLLALVAMLCLTFAASAADISGKWAPDPAAAPAGGGGGGGRGGPVTYTFKAEGATLTGAVTRGTNDTPIADGKIDGDKLSFTIMQAGRGGGDPMKVAYTGVVKGDTIELTTDRGRGPMTTVLKKQ